MASLRVTGAETQRELRWQSSVGYRFAPLQIATNGSPGFTLLPPASTGITFSNRLSDAAIAKNRLLEIGSGVALGDFDGDGLVDIYFCRLEGDNVLYRNLGNWKFEDVTKSAGVACPNQFSTGCVFADVDGDGDLDLLVNSLGGGTRLFLNDGKGRFTESMNAGLFRRFGATSFALADVDGDGDLDLYVTNYRTDTFFDSPPGLHPEMRRQADGTEALEPRDRFVTFPTREGVPMVLERGEPDVFYLNRGGGNFTPVPWPAGVFRQSNGTPLTDLPTDWGLSAMFRDLNGDGLPDLYVCNDFVYWPDRVWFNDRGLRFHAAPPNSLRCVSVSAMAVDVADINRDGFDDIVVVDMLSPRREFRAWQRPDLLQGKIAWPIENPDFRPEVARNTLHVSRGDGTFAEIAQLAGVAATDWAWSVVFLDVDLDGWEDLLVATGSNHDVQDADAMAEIYRSGGSKSFETRLKNLQKIPRRETASVALRNRRDLTFEDVSATWGFNAVGVAQGMALADLDNDGDLDVVINCLNAPARIYRNNSNAPRVAVRLKGNGENTRGIGAKIKVSGGPVTQTQEMIAGGRYCSGDDAMRVFAAGHAQRLEIEVLWRSGKRSLVTDAKPNCVYEIAEAEAVARNASASENASSAAADARPSTLRIPTLFEDVSHLIDHRHVDAPFNDFARQPLLPHKLSTLGPGICWADVDGDGHDDLLIGGGKGGRPALFHNDGKGTLTERTDVFPRVNSRGQTTVLCWRAADGITRILAGESNWEDADPNAPPFRIFTLQANANSSANRPADATTGLSATGPLALADIDGDGDLDLFLGGRVIAGRYPEPATSYLLRNTTNTFSIAQTFPNLGLVSGAVFTDLNGDGAPDLVLACEWGPLLIFRNDHGTLHPWNWTVTFSDRPSNATAARPALSDLKGWWNGVAAGDFDGDGRMDLVVSNWGRNWRTDQPPTMDIPVSLFYGDFAGDGIVHTLLASTDPSLSKVTPWRERSAVAAAIPSLGGRLPTRHAYGRASVPDVLGDKAGSAHELGATTPDSMVFLNRGDHFDAHRLPIEAQFAPAFGVSVADFDGDGNEDVFLAQNFFGVDAETSRHDAGTGLVLLGNGRGGFRALRPSESGIAIYGEQRGSAVADFDGDGRTDLVVAQQGGPTRLFRNARGVAGVRVALRGARENSNAIGAVVRLKFDARYGPAREIHAGTGYWSQDSATLILAAPTAPAALWVRWPGGQEQDWPWPRGITSIEVSTNGVKPK